MKAPSLGCRLGTLFLALLLSLSAPAQEKQKAPPTAHPQAEWYLVGRELALETRPVYKTFQIGPDAQLPVLTQLLSSLSVEVTTLKTEDYKLLKQGWTDALQGLPPAYSMPADQQISKVVAPLRGFHAFSTVVGSSGSLTPDDIEKLQHAVVRIMLPSGGHGTGFFVSPDHILTNKHVTDGHDIVEVSNDFSSQILQGTVIAISEKSDLSLIKVENADRLTRTVMELGDSRDVRAGEEITLFGYPIHARLTLTTTFGRISAKRSGPTFGDVFQLSGAEANPGNSGGPLVNNKGQVIGILTFSLDHITNYKGFTFCITAAQAIHILRPHCPEALVNLQ
ncbi:MAG: serine protease [Verrucomicrobiota bacterium]